MIWSASGVSLQQSMQHHTGRTLIEDEWRLRSWIMCG